MSNNLLSKEIENAVNAPESLKCIASISADGELHLVYKQSLHVNEDGNLEFYEYIESSQNNKNMVNSIWFDQPVVVNVLTEEKRSFEIKGIAKQALIAGAKFERIYRQEIEKGREDLSTVWIIEIQKISEKTLKKRIEEETEKHPHFRHLDQLLK